MSNNGSVSTTKYMMHVVFIVLLAVVLANGVYIRDRRKYPSRASNEESGQTSSHSRQPNAGNISAEITSSRRDPFRRILVLCNYDNECERKSFCHGGEGHKSCLPCRRSRRRCQRNGMCCHGYVCQQGRCIQKDRRYDTSYAKTSQSYVDEESISQHTKDNMRKRREDEVCDSAEQCAEGLCCAQHFWTRICKPILVEGDVCTKKRDRHSDVIQRCHCGGSLSCKRHPATEERYHTCQYVKGGKRLEIEDHREVEEEEELEGADRHAAGVLTEVNDKQESPLQIDLQLPASRLQTELYAPVTDNAESDKRAILAYESDTQSEFKETMGSAWQGNTVDQLMPENNPYYISSKPMGTSWVKVESSVQTGTESLIAVL